MAPLEISVLQRDNSLTYVDMLGLLAGLERMEGETSDAFLERVRRVSRGDRSLSWRSALLELAARLDLPLYPACRMWFDAPAEVHVGWSGLSITLADGTVLVRQPMLEISDAGTLELVPFRRWMEAVSAVSLIQAEWNVDPDAPAAQAARQSSRQWQELELVSAETLLPGGESVLSDSVLFDQPVSGWELVRHGTGWKLRLAQAPASRLRLRYAVLANPFQMVACPVILASGSDPEFRQVVSASGRLPEQILSVLRELLEKDRSYWAR